MPAPDAIEGWVRAALAAADGLPGPDLEVSVMLVDAAAMKTLNRDYRGKDKPTNVLSFPAGELDGLPGDEPRPMGDVVLCPSVVLAEAREQDKPAEQHWAHLCVHGALHLAGYDHVEPGDAAVMERLEAAVLGEMGIPDPYEARESLN